MKIDVASEIQFRTARSGGSGGQHVNKVETMVEGLLDIGASRMLTDEQKTIITEKLRNRINSEGKLVVRSQSQRSQLSNKKEVIRKIHELIHASVQIKKLRIATRPTEGSKQARLQTKKKSSEKKSLRKRVSSSDLL